jgi:MBG domain (YGX type)/Bacterial Ig domain
MQINSFRSVLTRAVCVATVLLFGVGAAIAQQQVNLTAAPTSLTMPDGSAVPMWGYSCQAVTVPSTATCAALHPNATGWSPVVITVPTGQSLTINLTNNLSFANGNKVPTSLTIVGQLGGGLGTAATSTPSPTHADLGVSWSTANTPGATNPTFVPPTQGNRVQSFATEVAAGATTALTWTTPAPGTYLIESGTHPSIQGSMGLYGILVVTAAPSGTTPGTAYPGVTYSAEVPLLFSEIDPVQNNAVSTAVNTAGFSETAVWTRMASRGQIESLHLISNGSGYSSTPTVTITGGTANASAVATVGYPLGTVTVGSGGTGYAVGDTVVFTGGGGSGASASVSVSSAGAITTINVTSSGTGYTSAPTITFTSAAGTGATATATLSASGGIVTAITLGDAGAGYPSTPAPVVTVSAPGGSGSTATASASVTLGGCGAGNAPTCYPPVVNYTPLYYLINGVAFDKTNASNSLFPVSPASGITGNVLVRLVNAGSRMHVPSIVGATTNTSAIGGFSLIAEDGNPLPGVTRVQNEVFMAAGKTYDVMVNAVAACTPALGATTCTTPALPVYDRELSLSGNAISRDAGMLAYISVNGGTLPLADILAGATANPDSYNVVPGNTLSVLDPSKGVIANDINVYGVTVLTPPANGTLFLNPDGTFTYVPNANWTGPDSFVYQANGNGPTATVTLTAATIENAGGITCGSPAFVSTVATTLKINPPGVLATCTDAKGYPLTVSGATLAAPLTVNLTGQGGTVTLDPNGGFRASVGAAGTYTFTFSAQNSQGTVGSTPANVTLTFQTPSNLAVTVLDGADKKTPITDYRWIIEEDRTFFVDPSCTTNPLPSTCPTATASGAPPVFGTNFHTSNMPVIATGCTGTLSCEGGQTVLGQPAVCDIGNGVCRPDTSSTGSGLTAVDPSQVYLDPTKRYYISVLPGDAAQPFIAGYSGTPDCTTAGHCGHGMGGAPIAANQHSVTVLTQPSPYPPATLSVFVFEDDYPLNGEHNAGGGIDILSPQEPGLGGFQITLYDNAGGTGDATGTPTYDMFNQPLTNSLAGTLDPSTGFDACPISGNSRPMVTNPAYTPTNGQPKMIPDPNGSGITGMIITCPKYEADGKTLSPLAGQAKVNNLYPGRYGVVANPGADLIARGEEWLQTNTLDGQKAHDSFMRIGEPGYFQEFGPGGYHVTIGFANPAIINARQASVCATSTACDNTVTGNVTTARMSRTPDERLYGSGSRASFAFTQCFASLGDPDGPEFAFVKCDKDGNFSFSKVPAGNWKLTLFDQWNDQIVDGISTPVGLAGKTGTTLNMGEIAAHQWQANFFTRTFIDLDGDGVSQSSEPGLPLVKTNVRYPDGSFSNRNTTDLNGYAAFNEEFPLFNWYVIETDVTRYKNTGTHVVYDAGGPTDKNGGGNSAIAAYYANTVDQNPLPADLSVPGAVYCDNADCTGQSIAGGPVASSTTKLSTGRIDPPWVLTEGWQGFSGQNNFLEFGKKPYAVGENGGIRGHVVYSSTRPFDDPQFGTQNVWEPLVPNVTINLYQELTAPDGTTSLTLVDTTQTTSFDSWAQGFRKNANGSLYQDPTTNDYIPNMNCPGQSTTDPFIFGLTDQPNYLDWYNSQHGGSNPTPLPYHSQYKCYDGMHNWNQLQPAPYDGMYQFPSVTGINPTTGKPNGTNCTVCVANPTSAKVAATDPNYDPYRAGLPMLPAGKYVTEVVVPPGFELVKEEDKNILIGDNFIAPVIQEFGGLGNVFILPDQASIAAGYNSNSAQNATNSLGRNPALPSHEGDTPTADAFWPCVGEQRTVPDYISLFPQSKQVAPFAGATRNLCDRKEVTLDDQTSVQAEFFIWTQTHIASKFTGVITDDFDAEFDPFSPQFGEKFAPAYLPVSIKDWAGNEISRTYSDQFGIYNGMSYSTWEVNPPNPTGYAPTMMVTCMNDPGKGVTPDPLFQPGYSNFCYELPFMPGATGYFDTPVVPTSAFAGGYNHPDCAYPDATPAIASVTSSYIAGPWVSAAGNTLTITALGDQSVENYGYSGPQITNPLFNKQKVTRHYGFGDTQGTVTIGGVAVPVPSISSWTDTTIVLAVPAGVPDCAVQQQAQYVPAGTTTTQCGQLVITAANGKQSVDTVTVTIGGKMPTLVGSSNTPTIQSAIDAASPGDMIIVPPGTYSEMVLMWKPVRLQGVGAASSIIDANPHPAGRLDPWRRQLVCLFGLALNGTPISSTNAYDPNLRGFTCSQDMQFSVDRLPLEATVGWTALLNGNLAEQLIEPSLMGAYEGAGITVLGKGVKFNTTDPAVIWASDVYPAGTELLRLTDCVGTNGNPYPSNFWCNPSRIDGMGITNSSQGGGGILVHGWGHQLEIANNRVHSNQGTLSGGITVGQGEHPDLSLAGVAPTTIPGSCESDSLGTQQPGQTVNQGLPFCYDMNVNMHNNSVTLNSSLGDELFSSSPAGAGGVTMCNGSDYYKFNYNWICGNMSTGDGGGVAHLGFSKNGDIEHNAILFNQSTNPSITTNGGGLLVMGAPDQDPPCALTTDKDCLSAPGTISPSDGTGPSLVINANLIMGNSADSGSGGGLRLQHINGTDVLNFPLGATSCKTPGSASCLWNSVTITNNIITNNVAGWDGGGVSLQDALAVNIVNNTIASNDSTAIAGPLFGSLFAPLASTPVDPSSSGVNCSQSALEQSCPQVAGLVSITNSPVLVANLPATVTCPPGHGTNGSCVNYSVPLLANNVLWQNRSFVVGVPSSMGTGNQSQQKVVTLYNSAFNGTSASVPAASQAATGACPAGSSYWEIGVRGDIGPNNHVSLNGVTLTLAPTYSVLTDAADYPGANNLGSDPALGQYCNGSRVPPELGGLGYMVTPGTNEVNALPTPVFSLTTSATVDEGNNWVNLRWGPLALANPSTGATLGNYAPAAGSPVIDAIASTSPTYAIAPTTDFFGNPRPDSSGSQIDIGAVELGGAASAGPAASVSPLSLVFGNVQYGLSSSPISVTVSNSGDGGTVSVGVSVTGANAADFAANSACTTALAPTQTCAISVIFTPNTVAAEAASLIITTSDPTNPTFTVALSGTSTPAQLVITASSGSKAYGGSVPAITPSYAGFVLGQNALALTTQPTCSTTAVSSSPVGSYPSTCSGAAAANYTITYVAGTVTIYQASLAITASNNSMIYGGSVPVITPSYTGFVLGQNALALTTQPTCSTSATSTSSAGSYASTCSGAVDPNYAISYIAGMVTVTKATSTTTITGHTPNPSAVNSAVTVNVQVARQFTGTPTGTVTVTASTGETCTATLAGGNGSCQLTLTNSSCLVGRTLSAAYSGDGNFVASASAGVTQTVIFPVPHLTSILVNSGFKGDIYSETLTGTGLTCTSAINVTAGGVVPSNVTVVNDTTVNATFTITPSGNTGIHNVSVTTPGGTSAPGVPFTVNNPERPTLTSVDPNVFERGTTTNLVALAGTNFTTNGTTVAVSGGGVNVSNTKVTSSTMLTATLQVTNSAAVGTRNVNVTNPTGTSNTVAITVQGPTLTSISPNSGVRGTTVSVTFTGTNLGTATGLNGLPTGVTIGNGSFTASSTTVTASLNISTTATVGTANISVVTSIGNTGTQPFTVQGPTLTSISPNSGVRGTTVPATLTGTNLTGASAVTITGGGVSCTVTSSSADGTTVTANCVITAGATLSARNVMVITPFGTTPTLNNGFTVANPSTATLSSISPTSGVRGTAVSVTLTGTNLTNGSSVSVSGGGVGVSGVSVNATYTQLTATFTISGGASLSARNVTVTNPNGTPSNAVTFTVVNPPTATLSTISQTSATHPATGSINVAVTLTGTNLTNGTTVNAGGAGVSVSGISVNATHTQLNATFTISSTATPGARNVTVTNPNATPSNAVTFTVN